MSINITVNGQAVTVPAEITVAAALALQGYGSTRQSASDQPRRAFCGMGQCMECRVTIDGQAHRLACMTPVWPQMCIETDVLYPLTQQLAP